MKKRIRKHPLAIRWFHWLNFPLLFVMMWSGFMIYWANDVYPFGHDDPNAQGFKSIHFFSSDFFFYFHLVHRLAEGIAWHFFFMWLFMANGLLYVLYTAISGEWRYLLPNRGSIQNAWQTILFEFRLSKHQPAVDKYNGAQRIAYTGVVLMAGGSLITGLAIFKPAQMGLLRDVLGGYGWARAEHFYLTLLYIVFFFVHVIQVGLAGWNNFRSMISGYELVDVKEASDVAGS